MKKRINRHFIRRKIGFAIVGSVLGFALANASAVQPTAGHAVPKPAWPDNGIAQRILPNAMTMFVENDHGKLRAWVVSEPAGEENVEALDFFSGQKMKVKVDREDDGHQEQSFTDPEGKFHSSIGQDYAFSGTSPPIDLPGISFDGNNIFLEPSKNYCSSNLIATSSERNYVTGEKPASTWNKFAIYHEMGNPKACSGGSFNSKITSALDLNDGTFLAIEGCFVFRLRKSDLSPVGSAPALRLIDESAMRLAINQAKKNNIQDVTAYIIKTLVPPTAIELSCKEY
ncbi:hypothetical protein K4A87_07525 [Xanthomonas fragariae]|uniref:hypothetical protein n=2 Tax=Xanthomonas fragariae TaxID=48664 RepID=UPI001ABE8C3E|nr:hypothetical protein [Xanthomonas fragariae]UKR53706.1 hypothetical protein K4A87_07525 [Xanthomonas fragariae]